MSRQVNVPTPSVQTKVVVPGAEDRAFELFTNAFAEWWPLIDHSVFGKEAATCVFEAREGGRIFERGSDGTEVTWGHVLEHTPSSQMRFTWHPGRGEETAQEVTVKFQPMMFGTTVSLEHGGWEALGDHAKEIRASYEKDWPQVLLRFAERAGK